MAKNSSPTRGGRKSPRYFRKPESAEDQGPKPPTMVRSRGQVATTYAPGKLFTWEGGRGICLSVPLADVKKPHPTQRRMIKEGIDEFVATWAARAVNCRPNGTPIYMEQCLDRKFLNGHEVQIDLEAGFEFTNPTKMGYVPYPLLFQCTNCKRLRHYESPEAHDKDPLPARCTDHGSDWKQVDVVFVHWSGTLEPLTPTRYEYLPNERRVVAYEKCGKCGSDEFTLHNKSTSFSDWHFRCIGCSDTSDLTKADEFTSTILGRARQAGETHEFIEINMLPVSYRANAVQYVQGSRFIVLEDGRRLVLLGPGEHEALAREIATLHNMPFVEPSDAEIQEVLKKHNRQQEWGDWIELDGEAKKAGSTARGRAFRKEADAIRQKWFTDNLIDKGSVQSPALRHNIALRGGWARRFDPIRLTLEHATFYEEHVRHKIEERKANDVLSPDRTLSDVVGDPVRFAEYQRQIGGLLKRSGIKEMVLVRNLPICEYTFGYSRVSSTPIYTREHNKRKVQMPVRLMAFPSLVSENSGGRSPIYVLEQDNEAFYVRLDDAQVLRWLEANGVPDLPSPGQLGATYLEQYLDFQPFMDAYRTREEGQTPRSLCSYVYMLLHSVAHQMIEALAETSGLDRDGIGELLYPADLAFVLYRRGMTPDLGNISAMWRNQATSFLGHMMEPRSLRCGSGSLCDARGAACPACILISDISCIAGNQLVSRAALAGGSLPMWEAREGGRDYLTGFFEICA
jgi:hypothetical protein